MSSPALEAFLARLYVDFELRERFILNPRAASSGAGLAAAEVAALEAMDLTGLELAAESFRLKREGAEACRAREGWRGRLSSLLRR